MAPLPFSSLPWCVGVDFIDDSNSPYPYYRGMVAYQWFDCLGWINLKFILHYRAVKSEYGGAAAAKEECFFLYVIYPKPGAFLTSFGSGIGPVHALEEDQFHIYEPSLHDIMIIRYYR